MPGSQYKQQGMPSQGGAAKKAMTAEEFERLLGNENTTTRITLSSERHYASEDDLSDVSVENYGAGNRKSSSQMASRNTSQNGRQNQSSQHQHQQQQQQHQGMPQQLSPQSTNGFPGAFPSRTHPPIRSNSQTQPQQRSENADLEHDAARRKETQSLADFLRNTGPESPQPVRSGSAGSLDKKKEKKKKTGFFGFGRKLSKKESSKEPVEPEEQQQTKHVQLQVPYDPFRDGAPSQQPTVTEQQQQQQQQQQQHQHQENFYGVPSHIQNREVRRSIIIAEDEGRFGAPLLDVSTATGKPRRPESVLRDANAANNRLSMQRGLQQYDTYHGPPRQQSLPLSRTGSIIGESDRGQSPMSYSQQQMPQGGSGNQHQSQLMSNMNRQNSQNGRDSAASPAIDRLRKGDDRPLSPLMPDSAFRVSTFGGFANDLLLAVQPPQNVVSPANSSNSQPQQQQQQQQQQHQHMQANGTTGGQFDDQQRQMSSQNQQFSRPAPPHSDHTQHNQHQEYPNDYLLSDDEDGDVDDDEDDWDEREYGDEYDDYDDLDDETLKNTELNAMIDYGISDVVNTETRRTNYDQTLSKVVSFSAVVEELLGSFENQDGELEYCTPTTSFAALKDKENERALAGDDDGGPKIKSRGSSLSYQGKPSATEEPSYEQNVYAENPASRSVPFAQNPPMDPVARSAESVNSQNHQAYPPYMDSVSSLPPMPSPIPQTAIPSNYMLGAAATRTASRSSDGPPMRGPPPTPAATSKPPSSNLPPPPMDPIPIAAQRPGPSQAVFKSPPAQPNNVFTNTPVPSVVTSSSPPTPTQVAGSPPSLASPTPPSTRTRKKVRHVQIQTRGPQTAEMETQTTLTSHTLTAQIQTLSTEASTLATKHAQTLSQLSSTTQAKEASDLQVLNLQKALDDSRAETNSLLAEVVRLRDMTRDHGREKETLQNTLQEERQRFDSLSVQAYKKIKELLMERQVLELETGTLKGQIEGLDTRHREWLEADTVK